METKVESNKELSFKNKLIAPKFLMCFFVLVAIFICYALRDVAFMLVLSYIVAYIVDPALDFLEKKKITRNVGVFIMVGLLILVVFLFLVVITPYFLKEILILQDKIPEIIEFFKSNFANLLEYIEKKFPNINIKEFSSDKAFSIITANNIQKFFSGVSNTLLTGYSYTMALVNACLFPIFAYYFCVDFDRINKAFFNLIPRQYKKGLNRLLCDIDNGISSYLRGQLLICFLLAILYAIGLYIVGVDLWIVIAFLSGFANLIPYIGTFFGICFASIMALVTGGGWAMVVGVLVVFGIVSFLESMFITPKIQGKNIGLSPLAIMLALIAGAKVMGIFGMLIAIPCLSALKVIFKYYYEYAILRTFPYKKNK